MTEPRRGRPPKSKVRPIVEPDELLPEGLPANRDADRSSPTSRTDALRRRLSSSNTNKEA